VPPSVAGVRPGSWRCARYCVGAPLARIELQPAFARLVSRVPGLRLAVWVQELMSRDDVLTGGLTELLVRW
jgi:cytochrome P450